jgi:prepilin-type N-terminal cleavage/methylation domain-containing protein
MKLSAPSPRCGYTLVEISVVLVIISLLTAGGLTLGAGMVNQAAHIDTKKILDQIDQSLRDYYTVNGRLPCPASRTLAITDADFGREVGGGVCTGTGAITGTSYSNDVRIGMIPVRALGLSDRAASDKYGNRILYAVTRQLTDAGSFGASDGAVQVLPATGAAILTDAAYFVWSAGKDHKGAPLYTTAATPTTCSGTALDAENCDNDNIFRDAPFNNGEVVANFFDDHTRWVPKFHLTAAESHSDSLWAANGDANLYSVGTDTNTGNTNVGIGTTAPAAKLDIDSSGDGAALLRLSSERAWQFEQSGTGNAAAMDLRSLVGNKYFNIKNIGGDSVASFYADTDPTASRVILDKTGVGGLTPAEVRGGLHVKTYERFTDSNQFGSYPPSGENNGVVLVVDSTNSGDTGGVLIVTGDDNGDEKAIDVYNEATNKAAFRVFTDGRFQGTPICRVEEGPAGESGGSTATCNTNEYRTGGGGHCGSGPTAYIHLNEPSGARSWKVDCYTHNGSGDNPSRAYVICCEKAS